MAKITISHEMAAKYPEFEGRFGETIDSQELKNVEAAHPVERDEEGKIVLSPKPAKKGKAADTDTETAPKAPAPKPVAPKPAKPVSSK